MLASEKHTLFVCCPPWGWYCLLKKDFENSGCKFCHSATDNTKKCNSGPIPFQCSNWVLIFLYYPPYIFPYFHIPCAISWGFLCCTVILLSILPFLFFLLEILSSCFLCLSSFFLLFFFFLFLYMPSFYQLNFRLLRPACLQKVSYYQKAAIVLPLSLWNQTSTF